jgi:ferredoxin
MSVSVVIDPRENCIMCCNCHSNCPEIFETSEVDGRSQIREEHRVDGEIDQGKVDESLEDCARVAVDLCPVAIIYVEK